MRVLSRPAFRNRSLNPYNALINEQLAAEGVTVREYRPWHPGRWDVVHIHWPETTLNHDVVSALSTTESLLSTLRLHRRRGARVVWTAHNLRSHGQRWPRWEALFWRRFTALVDGVIVLNEDDIERVRVRFPSLRTRPIWHLPHPHYRDAYPAGPMRVEARRTLGLPIDERVLLTFGSVLEYKNVPESVAVFRAWEPPAGERPHLLVAGRCRSPELQRRVERAAAGDARVRLDLRFIPDEQVPTYFRAADLVVLPYREVSNSGVALLALSYDRPVVLPAAGGALPLAREIGTEWVRLYAGPWSPAALDDAIKNLEALPERTDGAHLEWLAPRRLARESATIYRSLCASPGT